MEAGEGPANGAYAATKQAVEALSDALRWELEPFGIRVVLVEPGAIRTNFEQTVERTSGALLARRDSPYATLYARVAATNDRIRRTQPGPEAVADVILTALRAESPAARYPATIPFLARIASALPDVAKDMVVRRLYGLDAPAGVAGTGQPASSSGAASPTAVADGLAVYVRGDGPPLLHLVWPRLAAETLMNNLVRRVSYVDRTPFVPRPIPLRDWLRPPRPRAGWGSRVAWRLDYSRRLSRVRAPTLVLAGRSDPQMPAASRTRAWCASSAAATTRSSRRRTRLPRRRRRRRGAQSRGD
jgi:hypothetical protein